MPVITITTEWQGFDYHNGILKGKLAAACPGVPVIENASAIPPFNIQHAAFVIRNTFFHYPAGSVHIICVKSEESDESPLIMVEAQGHYFIGADNGIFNLILNSPAEKIILLKAEDQNDSKSGVNRRIDETSVFAAAAATALRGDDILGAGTAASSFREKVPFRATIENNSITGSIIFVDSYGNAISNITREIFARVFDGKAYNITVRSNSNSIRHISRSYSSEPISELVALFNSLSLLEIGINGSNASTLLSIRAGDSVRISADPTGTNPGKLF
jgi:S-adenosylmethionine hydrolase